jgi:hypothetical protein
VSEDFHAIQVGGLFAFHGQNEDPMTESQFFYIHLDHRFVFVLGSFNPLSQEILADDVLDLFGMFFFVRDPPYDLIHVLRGTTGKLMNLLHSLFDRLDMLGDHRESHFVVVDPAGNFTVGKHGWAGESDKREKYKKHKGFFHVLPPFF